MFLPWKLQEPVCYRVGNKELQAEDDFCPEKPRGVPPAPKVKVGSFCRSLACSFRWFFFLTGVASDDVSLPEAQSPSDSQSVLEGQPQRMPPGDSEQQAVQQSVMGGSLGRKLETGRNSLSI